MSDHKPQFDRPPEDDFDRDLSPDHLAGQNLGPRSSDHPTPQRTAYDIKPLHRCLHDFPDDELRTIPVLGEGAPLQEGATYLNLAQPHPEEFTALGGIRAGPEDALIPKDEVPYPTWNRLRGIEDPDRIGMDPYRRD